MSMNKILNDTRGKLSFMGETLPKAFLNLSSVGETLNDTRGKLSHGGETMNDTRGKLSQGCETFSGQKFSRLFAISFVLKNKMMVYSNKNALKGQYNIAQGFGLKPI